MTRDRQVTVLPCFEQMPEPGRSAFLEARSRIGMFIHVRERSFREAV